MYPWDRGIKKAKYWNIKKKKVKFVDPFMSSKRLWGDKIL